MAVFGAAMASVGVAVVYWFPATGATAVLIGILCVGIGMLMP